MSFGPVSLVKTACFDCLQSYRFVIADRSAETRGIPGRCSRTLFLTGKHLRESFHTQAAHSAHWPVDSTAPSRAAAAGAQVEAQAAHQAEMGRRGGGGGGGNHTHARTHARREGGFASWLRACAAPAPPPLARSGGGSSVFFELVLLCVQGAHRRRVRRNVQPWVAPRRRLARRWVRRRRAPRRRNAGLRRRPLDRRRRQHGQLALQRPRRQRPRPRA